MPSSRLPRTAATGPGTTHAARTADAADAFRAVMPRNNPGEATEVVAESSTRGASGYAHRRHPPTPIREEPAETRSHPECGRGDAGEEISAARVCVP